MKNITPCLAYICKITKIHSVILTILAILLTSAARTSAQEAYAVYDNGTLTFYYDNNRASYPSNNTFDLNKRTGTDILGEPKYSEPAWSGIASSATKVVFDASFADARPTTCHHWFQGFSKLEYITISIPRR